MTALRKNVQLHLHSIVIPHKSKRYFSTSH